MPGPEACLQLADWLHASKPALSDVSDSSEQLWELVLSEAQTWYTKYLKLDAIARLTSRPKPSEEVLQSRWSRVSRRIETMVLAASPTPIKEEISAARVSGLLPVVSRLFVIYSPGGLGEREIGLRNIQDPSPGAGVRDSVGLLRRWKRWCDRMTELGGTLPDPALRVKALDKITRTVLQSQPEVAFRVNLTRTAIQIDSSPDSDKVIQLHAQILILRNPRTMSLAAKVVSRAPSTRGIMVVKRGPTVHSCMTGLGSRRQSALPGARPVDPKPTDQTNVRLG